MEGMECHQKRTKHEHHIRNEVFFFGNNDLGHRPFSPFSSSFLHGHVEQHAQSKEINHIVIQKKTKLWSQKQIGFAGQPTTASFDFPKEGQEFC
jgi:hypothetical protein